MLTTNTPTLSITRVTTLRRVRRHVVVTVAVLIATACANADLLGPVTYPAGSLEASLETIRSQYNLPGLAVAIVKNGAISESAAIGVRRAGDPTKVSINDKWHVGSITKSMTATLAARLVDQGRLQWTTTVAEALPDLAAVGNPAWRSVTLAELLTMRGGVNDTIVEAKHADAIDAMRTADPVAQRRALVGFILAETPSPANGSANGSAYSYSNGSYALAGHMMERLTNTPWETLMQREVFAPLALTSAGFGAPASAAAAHPDQPWGHTQEGSIMRPVPPGVDADNPAAIGPAGSVHLSVGDLARYMIAHLGSARGGTAFLSQSSGTRVHASAGDIDTSGVGYAMGWVVYPDPSGRGPTLLHDGSNTNFLALVMMKPSENLAIVITTNAGGDSAAQATDAAFVALIQRATGIGGAAVR